MVGAFIDGGIDRHSFRVNINDGFALPANNEATAVVNFSEDARFDFPPVRNRQELLELVRCDNRHHALLALRHQNFLGSQRVVSQQHVIQHNVHAAIAVGGQLRGCTADSCRSQVLNAFHDLFGEELETALDEHFFGERVPDLHRGAFGGAALIEGLTGKNRCSTDSIATGSCTKENDLVPRTTSAREVKILVPENAKGQSVHQRVVLINGVKPGFATNVGQTQTVAIETNSTHHSGCDAGGVGVSERSKAQSVHHRHRPCAHGNNVANNSAHTGGCALEGLDEAGVIVAFNLEGNCPAFADVNNPSVFSHAHHQVFAHGVVDLLTKLSKVDLRGLIRAVLAPHHRIHGELAGGGPAAQQRLDLLVFVGPKAKRFIGLFALWGRFCVRDAIEGH